MKWINEEWHSQAGDQRQQKKGQQTANGINKGWHLHANREVSRQQEK